MDWVRSNVRRLHAVLRRRGWKRHDAEDIIQDAFLRMQAFCNEGGEVRNSEAFLVRTALNLSVNSRTRGRGRVAIAEAGEQLPALRHYYPAPEELLAAEECLNRVIGLVDTMPLRTRQIFLLHYLDEYTYPQIARQIGISNSAVEKHMARAMLALTQELSANE